MSIHYNTHLNIQAVLLTAPGPWLSTLNSTPFLPLLKKLLIWGSKPQVTTMYICIFTFIYSRLSLFLCMNIYIVCMIKEATNMCIKTAGNHNIYLYMYMHVYIYAFIYSCLCLFLCIYIDIM